MDCKKNLKNGGRDVFPVALGLISQIVEPRPQVFKFLLSKSSTMILEISLWKLIFCHKVWEEEEEEEEEGPGCWNISRIIVGRWLNVAHCLLRLRFQFRIVSWHVFPFHAIPIPVIIKFLDFWKYTVPWVIFHDDWYWYIYVSVILWVSRLMTPKFKIVIWIS